MRTVILQTTLLLLAIVSFSQTQLFKDYNFNNGGYYILGTFSESDPNGLRDTLGEFYTDDISILNQFKKEWVFKKPSPKYACGYHYSVFVCKDGVTLEELEINLNCNEIVSDKGYFYFDTQKLRMFKGKLKTPYHISNDFASLTQARDYRTKILSDSSLIMTPTPDWTKYEGTFRFTYKCKEGTKTCMNKEDSLFKAMKVEITKQYPGENFELSNVGGSLTEIFVEVRCNKTLEEKFKLYYRDIQYDKWKQYRLYLTTYWEAKKK